MALGCVFYRLLTGSVPFEGGTVADKLQRHATQPIQPLGVPDPIGKIVAFMMAKNAAFRFQHAELVVEKLDAYLDEPVTERQSPIAETLAAYERCLQQKQIVPAPQPTMPQPVPPSLLPAKVVSGDASQPESSQVASAQENELAGSGIAIVSVRG